MTKGVVSRHRIPCQRLRSKGKSYEAHVGQGALVFNNTKYFSISQLRSQSLTAH